MFLVGKSFWKPLDRWFETKMQKSLRTINPSDRKIYKITEDMDEIVKAANKIGHRSIYDNLYNNHSSDGNTHYKK